MTWFCWFPLSSCADGTVHNLNEYIDIRTADVAGNAGVDLNNAVFSEKLGAVISDSQLVELFSQIS